MPVATRSETGGDSGSGPWPEVHVVVGATIYSTGLRIQWEAALVASPVRRPASNRYQTVDNVTGLEAVDLNRRYVRFRRAR